MIHVHRLSGDVRLRCTGAAPTLSLTTEQEVTAIWSAAASDPARGLEDNLILAVARYDEPEIEAFTLPYRYFYAQAVAGALFRRPLKALAVSGIVLSEGRLVLGRRADWVTQDPGMLELVPSGSVDADTVGADGSIDLREQFNREAAEELGVGREAVEGQKVLGLIDDDKVQVVDIVLRAALKCSWEELLEAHRRLCRPEYTELMALTPGELQHMIEVGRDPISAVSIAIITHFCVGSER